MKTLFTSTSFRMLAITMMIAISTLNLVGQTTHTVSVTDNLFTPKDLTITAGDHVIWTTGGANLHEHNVNGNIATFASNPESFGNALGLAWTYEFVFNTPGTYGYRCDLHFAFGMTGSITVNASNTATNDLAGNTGSFQLYPNPASQYIDLMVPDSHEKISSLKVYSITGTLIDQKVLSGNVETFRYDVSRLNNGVYFMQITASTHKNTLKFIKQ